MSCGKIPNGVENSACHYCFYGVYCNKRNCKCCKGNRKTILKKGKSNEKTNN